jgi:hypothetical protein
MHASEHDLLDPKLKPIHFMTRIIFSAALAVALFAIGSGSAQTPASQDDQELAALIKEVQTQHAQIAENEGKIDAKMAEVTEAIRVARIFAGRGGQ